jgi:hypothetical protein
MTYYELPVPKCPSRDCRHSTTEFKKMKARDFGLHWPPPPMPEKANLIPPASRFHTVRIVEPKGARGQGAEVYLSGPGIETEIKIAGVIKYAYENDVSHLKRISLELFVQDITIELKDR